MKKLFLVGALALFGAMNAQFKVGAHVGLPMGDAGDMFSLNIGIDAAYTWQVAENFDLGITTGYSQYMLKSEWKDEIKLINELTGSNISTSGAGYIPIAATAQYNFDGGFNIGADLGYAMYTGDGDGGGFYYQPKVGYTFAEKHNVYIGYKGIAEDVAISSINLGYAYKF
ncbi:MAG: hypothetical protein LBE36_14425 [Flavobacteriaceae bacterium]|jgi:hypothetical protein|nr:hypothetical protein [Flavobacteriaceae bacterium]